MKSTVRVVAFAMLVAPLLLSESFGADRRHMSQGSALANRPKMLQTRIGSKQLRLDSLPAGSYTIGVGGYFPTIDSAYRRLEEGGIAGPITLLLIDTLYVAPFPPGDFRLIGPIAGAGPASRITIRPADNVAVRIEGNGTATLTFEDVSYFTLDGIRLDGPTRLKVHTSVNQFYGFNDGIDLWGDCNYDIVQNLTAASDRIDLMTATILLASKDTTTVDSCVVSGVSITSGGEGIYVWGNNPLNRPKGNVIRGNHIGSPTDSLISRGVQVEAADWTIVENNHIENLAKKLTSGNLTSVIGINSYYGSNTIIRNNVVHGLRGDAGGDMFGIVASGAQSAVGQGIQIYNNMLYDLQNNSTTSAGYIGGIQLWSNSNALVAYNSVWLNGTSADPTGSDALALVDAMSNVMIRNNILVNTIHLTSGGGSTALWCLPGTSFTSDYNDLLVDTTFANSYTASSGGVYRTLSQWQGAGYDGHSLSMMPAFKSATDLHIDTLGARSQWTPLANAGQPIAGCELDMDGTSRVSGNYPDIGAAEFWIFPYPPVGIEENDSFSPRTFVLEQNYPNPFNPRTVVSSQLPVASNVKLLIYDLLGREVAVLVNEKRAAGYYQDTFDASGLASGIYFYRLTAGQFVQSRKMVVVK